MPREDHLNPRILVVDDNPSIHRDFDLVLLGDAEDVDLEADERQMYGQAAAPAVLKPAYTLDHALSGLEGVEKVRQALAEERPYQLAFVDIRMPGIDGVETIQRIWECDPRMQVVICTAFADYSWEDLVRRWGQTDKLLVLKKPFDTIEVILLASTMTEKWFLARQAALKQAEMELLVARRTRRLLELNRSQPPADTSPAAPNGPGSGTELPLILLAEDDAKLASQITAGFGSAYRIIEARDGQEALRQAQENVPDLVITERALPRLDGLALCHRLKGTDLTSHIPVIVLMAGGQQEAQRRLLEAGADHYFVKPLNPPLLKARADELLRMERPSPEGLSPASPVPAPSRTANQADAQFLRRTLEVVDRHLSDFEFDVEALAKQMAVSRRQLFRKLKAVTGVTPNALIRTMRLKRAAELLRESRMTVTEITYAVGFSDLKHFRTVFREQFGVLPGEYVQKAKG